MHICAPTIFQGGQNFTFRSRVILIRKFTWLLLRKSRFPTIHSFWIPSKSVYRFQMVEITLWCLFKQPRNARDNVANVTMEEIWWKSPTRCTVVKQPRNARTTLSPTWQEYGRVLAENEYKYPTVSSFPLNISWSEHPSLYGRTC